MSVSFLLQDLSTLSLSNIVIHEEARSFTKPRRIFAPLRMSSCVFVCLRVSSCVFVCLRVSSCVFVDNYFFGMTLGILRV